MAIDMEQRIRTVGPLLPSDHVWKVCRDSAEAGVPNIEMVFYGHELMRMTLKMLVSAESPPEIDAVIASAQLLLNLEVKQ